MSHFEAIDPDEPATIENVLAAVMRLRDHDEAALAELVSEGRLREVFPFRPRPEGLPPDTVDEADVLEASPHPLTDPEYTELVQSSMRSDKNQSLPVTASKHAKGVGESPVDGGSVPAKAYAYARMGDLDRAREVVRLRPLHDRVIVKRIDEERKSAGGIVIPDTAAEKPDQGEIIAVGEGKQDDSGRPMPLDVKVGDKVLFGKYSGHTVKIRGEELLVMREDDLMGVIEGAKK